MSTNALNSLAEATGLYHRQTTEAPNRLTEQIQQLSQSSQASFEQQVQAARNLEAAGNRMERGIDKLADAVKGYGNDRHCQLNSGCRYLLRMAWVGSTKKPAF